MSATATESMLPCLQVGVGDQVTSGVHISSNVVALVLSITSITLQGPSSVVSCVHWLPSVHSVHR